MLAPPQSILHFGSRAIQTITLRALTLLSFVAAAAGSAPGQSRSQPHPAAASPAGRSPFSSFAQLDLHALRSLAPGRHAFVSGISDADGAPIDLVLGRFRVTSPETRFVLGRRGAADQPIAFDPDEVVLLRGSVAGRSASHAFLAVTSAGVQGYVRLDATGPTLAVTSRGLDADEAADGGVQVTPAVPAGSSLPPGVAWCGADTGSGGEPDGDWQPRGPIGNPGRRQIQLAVETDYEYRQLFDTTPDAAAYLVTLYGAISDIYIRDVDAHFTLSYVRLWESADDLFNIEDPLQEFRSYWNANMGAVNRDVAQFLSGRRNLPAGGVAYLDSLCTNNGYSWSGYTLGYFYDPELPHIFNRDIMIAGHELGHNSSALHTHDQGLDTCNDENSQPRRGTIMAYCGQTFTGGDANHDLWFHSVSAADMRAFIHSRTCVAVDCNVNGIADSLDISGGASLDANANGVPDECEDCNFNGVLDPTDINSATSLDRNINGIPDECEADCNGNGIPDDLDLLPVEGPVVFGDNFENDRGWTVSNQGATAGQWQRGTPVNDPGWDYDPISDGDGSGQCWLTGNVTGNSDVDDGATRLTSPLINMSAGGLQLQYEYYLFLTNTNGTDRLLVEGSNDGGTVWRTLIAHTTSGDLAWRRANILPTDFAAAGLLQTATMRFRFTANDGNPASIVEAGVDGIKVGGVIPPVSQDLSANNVPDECEPDCDANGQLDYAEIIVDMSLDLNRNAVLDSCEDCDDDGTTDLVELNHSQNVWVAGLDQSTLREYLSLYGTQTGVGAAGHLSEAQDVRITADRRILATSKLDHRVAEFNLTGAYVGDLVAAGAGGLSQPGSMLITPGGTLLVAGQASNSVIEYDLVSGAPIRTLVAAGPEGLTGPFGLALRPDGGLLVTSADDRVLEFDAATGAFIRVFAATGSGGLNTPLGLLVLPATGNLLVCSWGTNQILEYDGATGAFVRVFSSGGTADVMTLDQPWCLRLGPEGDVYVSRAHNGEGAPLPPPGQPLHFSNARIYQFDVDSGTFTRSYVMGVDSGLLNPTGFDFVPDLGTDCNFNQKPDNCDIALGTSLDGNLNGVPDECEAGGPCPGDVNGDRNVNLTDLAILLSNFGRSGGVTPGEGDVDDDDDVDLTDLAILLANFGTQCP